MSFPILFPIIGLLAENRPKGKGLIVKFFGNYNACINFIFCGLLFALSYACGSTGFVDSTTEQKNSAFAEGDALQPPESNDSSDTNQDGEEEVVAEPPTVISGAYLSCIYEPKESQTQASLSCRLESIHLKGVALKKGQEIQIENKTFKLKAVWEENGSTLFSIEIEEDTILKLEAVVDKIEGIPTKSESKNKDESVKKVDENGASKSNVEDTMAPKDETTKLKPNFLAPTKLSYNSIKDQSIQLQLTGGSDSGMPITFQIKQSPLFGTINDFDPVTGSLKYISFLGFVGGDSFTFVLKDGDFESEEFTIEVDVLEFMVLNDDFERLNPLEGYWVQSQSWGDGIRIFDRQTPRQSSLFLFGNEQNTDFDNVRVISRFLDFSGFSAAKLSGLYLLQDVGDAASGALLTEETMKIKICIKSSNAECGIDPRNESLLNDESLWISIFTPQVNELNDNQRDCKDMNWSNLDLDLEFSNMEQTYPDFTRNKVSIMLEATNMQAGMEDVGNINLNCNDVVIFDQLRFQGTVLQQ